MTVLGRLRAALGRDDATLVARARSDVRMGLSLNPPGCFAPLNRAITALERARQSPEVAALLGRALCAKAQAVGGDGGRDLRARAIAKLKSQLDRRGLSDTDRTALWSALAQAWMPLPGSADTPEQVYRQLTRARDAQSNALADAESHLAMAQIERALCQSTLCPDPAAVAGSALGHARLVIGHAASSDDKHAAQDIERALLQDYPRLGMDPNR